METNNWPAWYYGPNGKSQIFASAAEVPSGWKDHPSHVKGEEKAPVVPTPPVANAGTTTGAADELDADGHPFDPALHAATKSKTTAGLWRMKVGVSRPAAAPGYPKAALDL